MTGPGRPRREGGDAVGDALGRVRRCAGVECAYCRDGCPAYVALGIETGSPRGKNRVLDAYLADGPSGDAVVRAIMECALCGRCAEVCVADADPFGCIPSLRAAARAAGWRSPVEGSASRALAEGTPFGRKDASWAEGLPTEGRWAYFPGCNVLANRPDIARRTVETMRANGYGPVPVTELCCGSPAFNAGMTGEFNDNAAALLDLLARRGVRRVVVSCPGCLNVLENLFPPSRIGFIHFSEYLCQHPPASGGVGVPGRVAFHDPCHLARKCGVIGEPRSVLTALGCEVVEFADSGRRAVCCGGGGGFAAVEPERSRELAARRVAEAEGLGVEAIVTCCPTCADRMAREAGGRLDVLMLEDLLAPQGRTLRDRGGDG